MVSSIWFIGTTLISLSIAMSHNRRTKDLVPPKEETNEDKKLEDILKDLEVVESLEKANDTSRDSRALLSRLSFLAGMKTGLISTSGSLSASNSFRVFGKVMNTALSVSYGHLNEVDPLVPVGEGNSPVASAQVTELGATVSNDPPFETPTKEPASPPSPSSALQSIRQNFIKNHNAMVSRINHKFLRDGSTGRAS